MSQSPATSQAGKVLDGLDKFCKAEGLQLEVQIVNVNGYWTMQFHAGKVSAVQCLIDTFVNSPKILMDPFLEEYLKALKKQLPEPR